MLLLLQTPSFKPIQAMPEGFNSLQWTGKTRSLFLAGNGHLQLVLQIVPQSHVRWKQKRTESRRRRAFKERFAVRLRPKATVYRVSSPRWAAVSYESTLLLKPYIFTVCLCPLILLDLLHLIFYIHKPNKKIVFSINIGAYKQPASP